MGYLLDKAIAQNIKGPNGEWAWYWVPGEERFTKNLPNNAPNPPSGSVWPVARKVYWVPQFIAGKGPNGGGAFGYKRPLGGDSGPRTHAGIDLAARHKDVIRAVTDGKIISFYWFTFNVYALIVDHGSFVINYGEVDPESLDHFRLQAEYRNYEPRTSVKSTGKSGSTVKAGQPIALAGLMQRSSMLHLEIWSAGTKFGKQWTSFPNGAAPSGLYNPTNFVLQLAGKAIEAQPVTPEPTVLDPCR